MSKPHGSNSPHSSDGLSTLHPPRPSDGQSIFHARQTGSPSSTPVRRAVHLQFSILLILLLATFLRLYQLPSLPPGLNFDEAGSGVAALEILGGAPKIWWRLGGGQEPFWPYLTALSTTLLGQIPLALRLPAVGAGVLTVAAVYPLLLLLAKNGLARSLRDGRLLALLTMLGLAVSDWHVHFSRLGFRAILLPLFSTLAFYFFWHALAGRQQTADGRRGTGDGRPAFYGWRETLGSTPLILSALFTALAIYSYLAARLLPLIPVIFLLLSWLVVKIRPLTTDRRPPNSPSPSPLPTVSPAPPLPYPPAPLLLTSYFLLLTAFLFPLIIYFALNPADLTARAGAVSLFNPAWNQGDLPGTAWRTLTTTLGTFVGLTGDPNPLVNLPSQPALPLILVPFFLFGLIISLYYSIRPRPPAPLLPYSPTPPSPHLFLLCWWGIMLLPAVLAPEGAPHHLRLLGTIVPTYAFVAIGLVSATNWLARVITPYVLRFMPSKNLLYLLPFLIYLPITWQTYHTYFVRWPDEVDFTLPFDLYAVRLADDITHVPPDTAYLLPMDLRAGDEARHYTLDYLLGLNHPAYTYAPVDESSLASRLTQAVAGKTELRVVRWTDDKHREADAKELVTYLLETTAQFQGRESFPVYEVETYRLPGPQTVFALPVISQPLGVNFDNLLKLEAAFTPPTVSPGHWLPVGLTLAPLAPLPADYKASLRLVSQTGERVAQKDRVLLHNYHQGTSLWPPESVNEYYLLPVPPETPPGDYTVTVVIYHPDTLAPMVANGVAEVPLGVVQVSE